MSLRSTPPPHSDLLAILDLEVLERNLFRGQSPATGSQRVFGGQVIGQALAAAQHTVNGRAVHSLHAYFVLPGDPSVPIVYEVQRTRDGRSFATRNVAAIQHGETIFTMIASFQVAEDGFDHQIAMPDAPDPDSLPSEAELRETYADRLPEMLRRQGGRLRPVELRPTDPELFFSGRPTEPVRRVWIRARQALPDDPAVHAAVLAYASDMTIIDAALLPHGRSVLNPSDIQGASLDHAIWFHRPFRADQWLLYDQAGPSASGGRGLTRGSVFTRDGVLVASVVQEGLIRVRRAPRDRPAG